MKILLIFFFLLHFSCDVHPQQTAAFSLTTVAKGITSPVAVGVANDGSGRIFICEQTGKILIVSKGNLLKTPFLDISAKLSKVNPVYSEKGLLGIAFHPKYKSNGKFYVYYSAPSSNKESDHKSVVAEYKVSPQENVADANSEKIILEFEQPESNHNGGQLAFGPDNYLYIGSGDGGGAGDDHGEIGNGQNLNTFLGKILRIDIDKPGNGKNYGIPNDNPFVKEKDAKPEIWAYGLRNPWRFSFDKETGELFCADVGQNTWEEIDIIRKGKNYGWKIMEGNHCFYPSTNCDQKNLEKPIAEYDHKVGVSVTGGYVYRGKNVPELKGKYIFGDWKGKLFYLEKSGDTWKMQDLTVPGKNDNDMDVSINSFGEDENGEVYILCQKTSGSFISGGIVFLISKSK